MLTKKEIATALKIDGLPENKQDEIIQRLEGVIQRKVALKISDTLNGQELPVKSDDKETLKFLREKIPDFDKIIQDISTASVEDFVDYLKK